MTAKLSCPEWQLLGPEADYRPLTWSGAGNELNVGSLGQSQGIVDVHTEITDGVLDVCVA